MITSHSDIYDSLSLKIEEFDWIDKILDLMNKICDDWIFTFKTNKNWNNIKIQYSNWFNIISFNCLGGWIVAHFETQIL